ncbi:LysR family transcriptional regulator [uncultured Fusobacterium sp.]|uniref:LysR family transcriptional regulator n=1 Tax=uncultured Fusobacterium sp. TaxID=159267 RepID=UPI0025D92416|nr:LysR family transcriptional regulator [uncultured Fusobacterium sp.]MCF2639692.1 LysR family transcriptional regulator [Fusobacterium varium]
MNIQYLKYVVEVDKTGSINKAAKNLYMGQPNLSAAIKELEKELGISIFYRSKKGVFATKEGEKFLFHAKKIISQVNELKSLYKPNTNNLPIHFSIAACRATYITIAISNFINNLKNKKGMTVNFNETNSLNVINEVANGNAEIGIIRYQNIHENYFVSLLKSKNLIFEPLWESKLFLTFSENHSLISEKEIKSEMLKKYIEIVQGDMKVPVDKSSNLSTSYQPSPQSISVYDRGSHVNLLVNVKEAFMWVPILPENILKRNKLVQRECADLKIITKDILVYSLEREQSIYIKNFISSLKESIKNISVIDDGFLI